MNNNSWFKKENPFQTVIGLGGGATGFGAYSSSAAKVYVDEVFTPYVKTGTNASVTINNGIDLSGDGGMVWYKPRNATLNHSIIDTVRGVQKYLVANENYAENTATDQLSAFNNNGFTWGDGVGTNDIACWSFKEQKGFFDIVQFTGDGTTSRTLSHNLKCKPGFILLKDTSAVGDWTVYHQSLTAEKWMTMNTTDAVRDNTQVWRDTEPTDTDFTIGAWINTDGDEYIAYLFAGGITTGNHAIGGDGDASNLLTIPANSDWSLDGDFTVEIWVKTSRHEYDYMFTMGDSATATGMELYCSGSTLMFYGGVGGGASAISVKALDDFNWHHVAITRSGTSMKIYVDGVLEDTDSSSTCTFSGAIVTGEYYSGVQYGTAKNISNLRITKDQVLYSSNFTPPTEPLTTTSQGATASNVKLLCFNQPTTTAATVCPETITQSGSVFSKIGPFSEAWDIFGENADSGIIKCGSYVGQSGANSIELDWEPQWVMIKNIDSAENWVIIDCIRPWNNIASGAAALFASSDTTESTYGPWGPTETGWTLDLNHREIDQNGQNYIYVAIRRPDGYVGKPASAGTDALALDTGNGSATIPAYDSTFPVDFAFDRIVDSTGPWFLSSRLMGPKELQIDNNAAETDETNYVFDSNVGYTKGTWADSTYQAWMFKRGQGLDVVNFKGNGGTSGGRFIRHGLGRTPEMMWVKNRGSTYDWYVYHLSLIHI